MRRAVGETRRAERMGWKEVTFEVLRLLLVVSTLGLLYQLSGG